MIFYYIHGVIYNYSTSQIAQNMSVSGDNLCKEHIPT